MPINQPVKPNRVSKDLVNETIPFQQVLVIDQNGESLGVLPRKQALALAEKAGLDLYCVSPNARPAVCKIVNFGKLKFDRQKKEREAHKNQSSVVIKEMRFTPMTSTHDLETKANQCIKFLEKNMKIKVSVFMKGRMVTKIHRFAKRLWLCRKKTNARRQILFLFYITITKKIGGKIYV